MNDAELRRPRRERGRPRLVDRDAVIAAVIAIGFEDLTLTSLAARLGVQHPTLYRHIRGREDAVLAAIDSVVESVDWPEGRDQDWRLVARAHALLLAGMYDRYPGLAGELGRMRRGPDSVVAVQNRLRGAFVDGGFRPYDAILCADMLAEMVRMFYDYRRTEDGRALSHSRFHQELTDRMDDAVRGADPRVADTLRGYFAEDAGRQFEKRLAVMIAGFESLAPAGQVRRQD